MRHKPDSVVVRRGRRRFLLGAGAVGVALPFLESLSAATPARAWSPERGKPKRLIVMQHGHGWIMENLLPGPGFTQAPILEPVARRGLADKMLVVGGIDNKVMSGHAAAPAILSCVRLIGSGRNGTHPVGPSVEHVIARHMQDGGSPRRFDLMIENNSTRNGRPISGGGERVFWSGRDEHIPSTVVPSAALDRIYTVEGDEAPVPSVDYRALRRRSVLSGVLEHFNALRGRVSRSDRDRLDRHAERLREIERGLAEEDDVPPPPMNASCTSLPDVDREPRSHARAGDALVDILAFGMSCSQADVGTFKIADMAESAFSHIDHPDIGPTFGGENYHGAWHKASDQRQARARRAFTAIDAWYGELFARLLERLDEVDEGEGTALDNTMVVWLSDFGHGRAHSSGNLPVIIAGNAGGASLGRHVSFSTGDPNGSHRNDAHAACHNLCVTMTQAFGIRDERFGDYGVGEGAEPGPLSL